MSMKDTTILWICALALLVLGILSDENFIQELQGELMSDLCAWEVHELVAIGLVNHQMIEVWSPESKKNVYRCIHFDLFHTLQEFPNPHQSLRTKSLGDKVIVILDHLQVISENGELVFTLKEN